MLGRTKVVSEQDVFNACEQLLARGVPLTIDGIRRKLGGGNYPAIANAMQKFLSDRDGDVKSSKDVPSHTIPSIQAYVLKWLTVYDGNVKSVTKS